MTAQEQIEIVKSDFKIYLIAHLKENDTWHQYHASAYGKILAKFGVGHETIQQLIKEAREEAKKG